MNAIVSKIGFLAGLSMSVSISASQQSQDPFTLSLEELVQLKVTVSSNHQQSLRTSPGIVRVITQETISQNGWQDLQQVLLHIPGIQISVSKNGHSNIWMRGVQSRNNNKVLLLVDGVPQHDNYYGNFHLNNQIPLKQIERIEVLNGPGGVVHGANSFAGVISISTLSDGGRVGGKLSGQNSYASANSEETSLGYELYADYDWESELGKVYLFASSLDQEGFQPQYNRRGEFYDRSTDVDRQYLLAKYQKNAFNIQFSYSDYTYPYLYTKADRWQGYDKQVFSTSANYEHKISDTLKLKLSGFFINYDFSRPKKFYDDARIEASGQSLHNTASEGINATLLWPISDDQHASFGFDYSRDWARDTFEENTDFPVNAIPITTKDISLVEDTSRNTLGFFTEYQQRVLADHWLHLGLRYDRLSDFDDQSSYRISLTKEVGDYYHKVLFGTSYRVPSYREYLKKYNDTYNQVNPLQPEQMKTIEFAFGYTPNGHEFLFVWYMNQYKDFIKEVSVNSVNGVDIASGDGDEYGFNFDQIDISGFELSWSWVVTEKVMINSSISYLINATEDPGVLNSSIVSPSPISSQKSDLLFLSDITANIQVNYQLSESYSIYWDAIYYSDRPYPDNYQAKSSIQNFDNAKSIWLSNIQIQSKLQNNINLGLGINNLFDSDIYSPNLDPADDYDNQWPKCHIEFTAQWAH